MSCINDMSSFVEKIRTSVQSGMYFSESSIAFAKVKSNQYCVANTGSESGKYLGFV